MRRALPALAALLALAVGCQREDRDYRTGPGVSETRESVALSSLSPGANEPIQQASGKQREFETNAYHVSQGKKLYKWFNCAGCHSPGGGGDIGPPLIDDRWIYGGSIAQIVQTIREGRPNGMPSFRGRITDDQIWEVAAYVRSMSGNVRFDVAPARDDDMHPGPAENRRPTSPPVPGGTIPPSAEAPR